VRVAGTDGAPVAGALLVARNQGDRGKFRGVELAADGTATVAYVGDEVSLAAHAPGTNYATATGTPTADELKLDLAPLPPTPVRVDVPNGAPRGGAEIEVAVVLKWRAPPETLRGAVASVRDETDPREAEEVVLAFPAQGPATATVPLAGWYEIGLRVRKERNTSTRMLETIRIQGAGLVVVPLTMEAREIAEIVRSFEER
jgi:hypothetical protein